MTAEEERWRLPCSSSDVWGVLTPVAQSSGLTLPARVPVCPCAASPRERELAVGFCACSVEKRRIRSWPESLEPGNCWMNADFSRWSWALRRNREIGLWAGVQSPFILRVVRVCRIRGGYSCGGCNFSSSAVSAETPTRSHPCVGVRGVAGGQGPLGELCACSRSRRLGTALSWFLMGFWSSALSLIIHPRNKRRHRQA